MNRQKKEREKMRCKACKEIALHLNETSSGLNVCDICWEIIREDSPQETQRFLDKPPIGMDEEKMKLIFDRIFKRYTITHRRFVFDRDVLDSETEEVIFKFFVRNVFDSLDTEMLFGSSGSSPIGVLK